MYGRVVGVTVLGVGGYPVTVEAFVGRGLPSLTVTGLPGATVQDGRERIRPAVEHAGLEWPLRRVVVNLAPGNLRKEGAGLDLPIAVSVLVATRQVPPKAAAGHVFYGEVSLKGEVLPTPGVISVAIAAARRGLRGVIVPVANAVEAAQVAGLAVTGVASIQEVVGFLRGTWRPPEIGTLVSQRVAAGSADLSEVRGQDEARRALEGAAEPCPCGFSGDPQRSCRCRPDQVDRYRQKLSGPLLDRIDLRLTIPRLTKDELLGASAGESSAVIRDRVIEARDRQRRRYSALGITCNAHLPGPIARREARLCPDAERLLGRAVDHMALTGRGFDRVIKVARTVADLAGADRVSEHHGAAALAYRTACDQDQGLARAG